jgi:NADH dehydrogenase (ubiquinone) 1 alpha subcomplex subunit 2
MATKYAFATGLRELRFLFCQTAEHSAAVRSFITRAYPTMKKHNPEIPILVREAAGTLPRVFARYDLGRESSASLEGLSDQQIEDTITSLVKQAEQQQQQQQQQVRGPQGAIPSP